MPISLVEGKIFWFNSDHKKPPVGVDVIVAYKQCNKRIIVEASYKKHKWTSSKGFPIEHVVHWAYHPEYPLDSRQAFQERLK